MKAHTTCNEGDAVCTAATCNAPWSVSHNVQTGTSTGCSLTRGRFGLVWDNSKALCKSNSMQIPAAIRVAPSIDANICSRINAQCTNSICMTSDFRSASLDSFVHKATGHLKFEGDTREAWHLPPLGIVSVNADRCSVFMSIFFL